MRPRIRYWLLLCAVWGSANLQADEFDFHVDGHTKARVIGQLFPDNSIFHELTGSGAVDLESDLRLNFEVDYGGWSGHAAYQAIVLYGDRVEYTRELPPAAGLVFDRLPNDRRRLMDLTGVIRDQNKSALLHRLDRAWVGHTGRKTVFRVGRQAISWGNGFFYAPMDIVNPFDPATVDTEYKAGDDMAYGQYLRDNGHDIQAAAVFRRDPLTGDVESDQGTVAVKYHGLAGNGEYDLLVADSYGDTMLGIGGNISVGGAVVRGDVVMVDSAGSITTQIVANYSYSWVGFGKNMSGVLEYYHNGFGQKNGNYSPEDLAENPELLRRIARGEVFALGQNYLAGGVTIELSPLWMMTPNMFLNLDDGSALLQIVTQHNMGDNLTFLGAINVPIGPDGSEYGGIATGAPNQYLSTDLNVFAQIAWYF